MRSMALVPGTVQVLANACAKVSVDFDGFHD